jgi:hypothetical protein
LVQLEASSWRQAVPTAAALCDTPLELMLLLYCAVLLPLGMLTVLLTVWPLGTVSEL